MTFVPFTEKIRSKYSFADAIFLNIYLVYIFPAQRAVTPIPFMRVRKLLSDTWYTVVHREFAFGSSALCNSRSFHPINQKRVSVYGRKREKKQGNVETYERERERERECVWERECVSEWERERECERLELEIKDSEKWEKRIKG